MSMPAESQPCPPVSAEEPAAPVPRAVVTVPLSRLAREDGRRGQGSGQFPGLAWRRRGGGVECLARADRVTRALVASCRARLAGP